jgi:hypothetical protein
MQQTDILAVVRASAPGDPKKSVPITTLKHLMGLSETGDRLRDRITSSLKDKGIAKPKIVLTKKNWVLEGFILIEPLTGQSSRADTPIDMPDQIVPDEPSPAGEALPHNGSFRRETAHSGAAADDVMESLLDGVAAVGSGRRLATACMGCEAARIQCERLESRCAELSSVIVETRTRNEELQAVICEKVKENLEGAWATEKKVADLETALRLENERLREADRERHLLRLELDAALQKLRSQPTGDDEAQSKRYSDLYGACGNVYTAFMALKADHCLCCAPAITANNCHSKTGSVPDQSPGAPHVSASLVAHLQLKNSPYASLADMQRRLAEMHKVAHPK